MDLSFYSIVGYDGWRRPRWVADHPPTQGLPQTFAIEWVVTGPRLGPRVASGALSQPPSGHKFLLDMKILQFDNRFSSLTRERLSDCSPKALSGPIESSLCALPAGPESGMPSPASEGSGASHPAA